MPAAIVTGNDRPVTENAELLLLTFDTVTLAPVAERLSVAVRLLPTLTLPKSKVEGLTVSWPVVATPEVELAESGTDSVEFDAFEVIARLPLAGLAEELGLNIMVKLALFPAAKVSGRLSPLTLNPVPVTGACVTVMLAVPLLVKVAVCDWLTPACTLLKVTLPGLTLRSPEAPCVVVAEEFVLAAGELVPIAPQPSIVVKASAFASSIRRVM